jgi:RNA polymerase sigma factor (sigma-70 family)
MGPNAIPQLLVDLRQSLLLREGADRTDGQLLAAFVAQRDALALEALVRRHAPLVWGVCRRTLANHHDAEDAFQATFLVLVRKAASIGTREPLANWLYGVANKTACKARQMAVKRYTREAQGSTVPEPQAAEAPECAFGPEFWQLLHEELTRLPEKYRAAIVLCDLKGRSRADAASQLGVREGTVASRLARGRALLARRLTRRGLGLSATSFAAIWPQVSQALPDALLGRTIEAAGLLATGQSAGAGVLSTKASAFTDAVLRAMAAAKWKTAGALLLLVGLALGAVIVIYQSFVREPISPDQPSPSPVTVTVVAAYPGASPEEVERQVAVPLEVGLAGAARLESVRSKSVFGACLLYASFQPTTAYADARSEVINRLTRITKLPPNVTPQIAPGPGGDSLRYVLTCPQDEQGKQVYTLHDLRGLQDGVLEREFRAVPGVADVVGSGGIVKRYEIHPDPDRLRRYGITLNQLADAIARGNASAGGDYVNQGTVTRTVRGIGLFEGGAGQFTPQVLKAETPLKAAELLRAAERQRMLEIRQQVVTSVDNKPILVEDVVEGGRVLPGEVGTRGVVTGGQPRTDRVFSERADVVQGVILVRVGDDLKLLRGVRDRVRELNATAGKLLPGVRVEPYYGSTDADDNHLWVHGTLALDVSLERATDLAHKVRAALHQSPKVDRVISQLGGSAQSFNQVCFFVGLKAQAGEAGKEPRPDGRQELIEELSKRLTKQVPDTDWLITASDPLALERIFPDTPAEHLLLIVGPDNEELARQAGRVRDALGGVPGIENVGIFPSTGPTGLEFRIDPEKCAKWGLKTADVAAAIKTALAGEAISQKVEGKTLDISLRWPPRLRESETSILDLPLDVLNNMVVDPLPPGAAPSGAGVTTTTHPVANTPRLRLRDVVSPVGIDGRPDPSGDFYRSGPVVIYRSQGKRVLPIRFSVRGRPLAEVRAAAAKKITPLLKEPYRIEWTDAPRE